MPELRDLKSSLKKLLRACCPSTPPKENAHGGSFLTSLQESEWLSQVMAALKWRHCRVSRYCNLPRGYPVKGFFVFSFCGGVLPLNSYYFGQNWLRSTLLFDIFFEARREKM